MNGWPFTAGGGIGIISGQAAVDYATQRVYFTSYERAVAPDNRTAWCPNLLTGGAVWAKAYTNVAAGPTLRGGRLYVGTNGGQVLALDATNGNLVWSFNTADGPVNTIPLGDASAAAGSPTIDTFAGFAYVGTEAGSVYAGQIP